MQLRRALPSDAADIRSVHLLAFPTPAEADLVDRLVGDGDATVSIVAVEDGRAVGHVLLSRMDVQADGRPVNAVGLAPVAVVPGLHGRGIGSALIEAAIGEARQCGFEIVFVLGDTDFYRRFGFDAEKARPFGCPYAGPHFQALVINSDMAAVKDGMARYAPAFDAL